MKAISTKLIALGLDSWLRDQACELCKPEQGIARITVVNRGQYIVRNEYGEIPAKATRKFINSTRSKADMPCVGDWVCMDYHGSEDYARIHTMLPRKSLLRRKSSGRNIEFQMIAANIDVAFIVQSCHYDFNVSRLERYLVMVNEGRVEPLLILTKTDLIRADELEKLISEIRTAGINTRIIAISNVTGEGLELVKEIMTSGKTYCMAGSSGVGKSTLINQLIGQDTLKTRTVSNSGEGRHTTVRRQLIILEQGAMIIDTPGMREVGILGAGEAMEENFDDIVDLSMNCRFTNCSHTSEPGCTILQAIQDEKLPLEHYQNYLKLKAESEVNEMSRAARQRKRKTSGKDVHSVMQHKGILRNKANRSK